MSQKGHGNDLRIQAFVALLVADFFLTADYSVFPAAVLQVIRWLQLAGRLVSKILNQVIPLFCIFVYRKFRFSGKIGNTLSK